MLAHSFERMSRDVQLVVRPFVKKDSSTPQNAFALTGAQRGAIFLAVRGWVYLSFPNPSRIARSV
jgi:hypothetical protein